MNWFNLKKNKCPKCGKKFEFYPDSDLIFCSSSTCGFQISERRLQEIIVGRRVNDKIDKEYKKIRV